MMKYAHDSSLPENGVSSLLRLLSVVISLITAVYILEFKTAAKVSKENNNGIVVLLFFIIAVSINFGLTWIIQSLYLSVFDVADQLTREIDKIKIGY
jgi:hypothetical protein